MSSEMNTSTVASLSVCSMGRIKEGYVEKLETKALLAGHIAVRTVVLGGNQGLITWMRTNGS